MIKTKFLWLLTTAASIALLSSCAAVGFGHKMYLLDYKMASQGKIFITESNSVSFDYEPIASIVVEEIPGMVKNKGTENKKVEKDVDPIYGGGSKDMRHSHYEAASVQSALNFAAQRAIEMGGDGLINMKTAIRWENKKEIIVISGMVIKRK